MASTSAPVYDDAVGVVRLDGVIDEQRAADLAARCRVLVDTLEVPETGDRPSGGARRLTSLGERLPETLRVVAAIEPLVEQVLGPDRHLTGVAFRCPGAGCGRRRLHADDVPRLELGPDSDRPALQISWRAGAGGQQRWR